MRRLRPETALRAVLLDNSELFALTGNRIFRGVAEQRGNKPYCVFARLKTESHQHMEGASGLFECDVMFSWCGLAFDDLEEVADLADQILNNFSGLVEVGGKEIDIQHCFLVDDRDGDVQLPDGSGQPIYCIEQIYRAAFKAVV